MTDKEIKNALENVAKIIEIATNELASRTRKTELPIKKTAPFMFMPIKEIATLIQKDLNEIIRNFNGLNDVRCEKKFAQIIVNCLTWLRICNFSDSEIWQLLNDARE